MPEGAQADNSPSWIARERNVDAAGIGFSLVVTIAAIIVLGFLVVSQQALDAPNAGEEAFTARPAGIIPLLTEVAGTPVVRTISAATMAAGVAATAIVGQRLFHSQVVGGLAAAFVALDPAALAAGRLALPTTMTLGLGMLALAFFLASASWMRWLGSVALFAAVLVDPRMLVWSIPLAAVLLLRGHIYAAPKHLGLAAVQVGLVPAAGLLVLALRDRLDGTAGPACIQPQTYDALRLAVIPDTGGLYLVHNPLIWFAGLAALAATAFAALWHVGRTFRIARLPGRVQLRLPEPLARTHARILWLAALALFAPLSILWLPLFALALAAGLQELSKDAPGFGAVSQGIVVVFAGFFLLRMWPVVFGGAATLSSGLPWGTLGAC